MIVKPVKHLHLLKNRKPLPGTTYYMRFWSSSSTHYATFKFCVQETQTPVNDNCANAATIDSHPVGTVCDTTYHKQDGLSIGMYFFKNYG